MLHTFYSFIIGYTSLCVAFAGWSLSTTLLKMNSESIKPHHLDRFMNNDFKETGQGVLQETSKDGSRNKQHDNGIYLFLFSLIFRFGCWLHDGYLLLTDALLVSFVELYQFILTFTLELNTRSQSNFIHNNILFFSKTLISLKPIHSDIYSASVWEVFDSKEVALAVDFKQFILYLCNLRNMCLEGFSIRGVNTILLSNKNKSHDNVVYAQFPFGETGMLQSLPCSSITYDRFPYFFNTPEDFVESTSTHFTHMRALVQYGDHGRGFFVDSVLHVQLSVWVYCDCHQKRRNFDKTPCSVFRPRK